MLSRNQISKPKEDKALPYTCHFWFWAAPNWLRVPYTYPSIICEELGVTLNVLSQSLHHGHNIFCYVVIHRQTKVPSTCARTKILLHTKA